MEPGCMHPDVERVPDELGDMRENPRTGRVEAPVLRSHLRCRVCGSDLPEKEGTDGG